MICPHFTWAPPKLYEITAENSEVFPFESVAVAVKNVAPPGGSGTEMS